MDIKPNSTLVVRADQIDVTYGDLSASITSPAGIKDLHDAMAHLAIRMIVERQQRWKIQDNYLTNSPKILGGDLEAQSFDTDICDTRYPPSNLGDLVKSQILTGDEAFGGDGLIHRKRQIEAAERAASEIKRPDGIVPYAPGSAEDPARHVHRAIAANEKAHNGAVIGGEPG